MRWIALFIAPALFAQDAKKFLEDAEQKLMKLNLEASHADWIRANFITYDSEVLSAAADERAISEGVRLAKGAAKFDKTKLPPDMARKILLLKNGLVLATPANP